MTAARQTAGRVTRRPRAASSAPLARRNGRPSSETSYTAPGTSPLSGNVAWARPFARRYASTTLCRPPEATYWIAIHPVGCVRRGAECRRRSAVRRSRSSPPPGRGARRGSHPATRSSSPRGRGVDAPPVRSPPDRSDRRCRCTSRSIVARAHRRTSGFAKSRWHRSAVTIGLPLYERHQSGCCRSRPAPCSNPRWCTSPSRGCTPRRRPRPPHRPRAPYWRYPPQGRAETRC
jgi:hypothetical protein